MTTPAKEGAIHRLTKKLLGFVSEFIGEVLDRDGPSPHTPEVDGTVGPTVRSASEVIPASLEVARNIRDSDWDVIGIPLGRPELDPILQGWRRGELSLVASGPLAPRLPFLRNSAFWAAQRPHPAALVPAGTTTVDYGLANLAATLGKARDRWVQAIYQGEEDDPIDAYAAILAGAEDPPSYEKWAVKSQATTPLHWIEMLPGDWPGFEETVRSGAATVGLDIVFIEDISYLAETAIPSPKTLGAIARRLKRLAAALDIAIVSGTGLEGDVESPASDWPGSRGVAEAADAILVLDYLKYRPPEEGGSEVEVRIVKNKNGRNATHTLGFRERTQVFNRKPIVDGNDEPADGTSETHGR